MVLDKNYPKCSLFYVYSCICSTIEINRFGWYVNHHLFVTVTILKKNKAFLLLSWIIEGWRMDQPKHCFNKSMKKEFNSLDKIWNNKRSTNYLLIIWQISKFLFLWNKSCRNVCSSKLFTWFFKWFLRKLCWYNFIGKIFIQRSNFFFSLIFSISIWL